MNGGVVFVADAGEEAGLGHIGRSSSVAVALRCHEIQTRCYAYGADEPFRFDGIDWLPANDESLPDIHERVVVIDSYRIPEEVAARLADTRRLVVIHDIGEPPRAAALVVTTAEPGPAGAGWASGLAYAALRRDYWGLPKRTVSERIERVLVTTGSGRFAEAGRDFARSIAEALPETTVTLVVGPHAGIAAPQGVTAIGAPDSLLAPLLAADVAVSTAGQSALEAAATGTPCIAVALADNQRGQALRLADAGAVRLVDPPAVDDVTAACIELGRHYEARSELSRNGQRAVDGYGALRIAFAIARL